MSAKSIQLLAIILPSIFLIFQGIQTFIGRDFYENFKFVNLLMGILAFVSYVLNNMSIRETANGFSKDSSYDFFIIFISIIFICQFVYEVLKKEVTIRYIAKDELISGIRHILTSYGISYEDSDSEVILRDIDASIIIKESDFSKNTYRLRFKHHRNIVYLREILEDLKAFVQENRKKGLKLSGLLFIILGIFFILTTLKLMM